MSLDTRCQVCSLEGESINHVIFSCALARQVWTMFDLPSPEHGFDSIGRFSNFSFLLKSYKNRFIPLSSRCLIPWFIWKNRNGWLFEGKLYLASDVVKKAGEEKDQWFEARSIEDTVNLIEEEESSVAQTKWSKPPDNWLKCNVGSLGQKRKQMAGASWVFRGDKRTMLLHSRRYFAGQKNVDEEKLLVLVWAVESMGFHRVNNVIFAYESPELVGSVTRPKVWPSFGFHSAEILKALEKFTFWSLILESKEANRGVCLIVKSVTQQNQFHSYVSINFPSWLTQILINEST